MRPFRSSHRSLLPRRPGERGFTLVELSVVVIIISVFAALALPQVARQLRDRRVHETAQRVANIYRDARLRALGQGGAVLVRYTQGTNAQGRLDVREAIMGSSTTTSCQELPQPRCTLAIDQWEDTSPGGTARTLNEMEPGREAGLDRLFLDPQGDSSSAGPKTFMDVCYTPLGRTFVRYAQNVAMQPLRGVPVVDVFRTSGTSASTARVGRTRKVLVVPSGAARLEL